MDLSQILSIIIFALMFGAIIHGKIHRFIPALAGAVLVILVVFLGVMRSPETVASVVSLEQITQARFWFPGHEPFESQGVNWQTIIFIAGMMVMVEGLADVGFFRWLCLYVARLARCRVIPILILFMILSGFLAMFIDSITVLLFLATVTIELAHMLKFNPVPIIIAQIFAANTGGAATMSGDPPNIIIGTAFGYTFMDFAVNTGLIAWASMALSVTFFYLVFGKTLRASQTEDPKDLMGRCPAPQTAITDPLGFKLKSAIFVSVIVLLITHAQTGLSVASIGVIAAALTLLSSLKTTRHIVTRLDWRTLLFFIGLFVTVGALEETGVLRLIAGYIGALSQGNLIVVITIILWFSAFASGIVDNIPLAATMVPVISHLSATAGFNLATLAWTLALGTDIGGNATPIGASANVVGISIAEREGYPIGWGKFLKFALPGMILVIGLVWLLLILRYA
ncbi:MAG: anion permease [Chloroflexi bacterium]|nr:anion permease [Chloroflexota bacterium]